MVVDWRAPISLPFYRAAPRAPMGVRLRRRFGFQHGRITAFEDERLGEGSGQEYSRLLEEEIERPRVGPMRDIVATIQPEQDVIVRVDLATSVCVQGAPGTGKTAVGLHRAAYLLYAHRDQLARQGVLVVGPNASFLSYIGDVLPALGEITAEQTTVGGLVEATLARADARHALRGEDPAAVASLKGDARMAEVLRRAVWGHVETPTEGLVVPRGASRWRVPTYQVEEILEELRGRGVRYAAARAMFAQRLAHAVLVRMEDAGEAPDDRVQDAVARSRPVKAYVDACWPALAADRLVHRLLTDREFLRIGRRWAPRRGRAAGAVLAATTEVGAFGGLEPRRRRAGRRGGRPARAHSVPRTRRPRRGAGPLADDAAGCGQALDDRVGDRPRGPRPGDHPVGHPELGRGAEPPRQAGRPRRGAHPGVPGARRGHRLRRAAAPGHRAGAAPTDLGSTHPRRARAGPGRRRGGSGGVSGLGRAGRVHRDHRPGQLGRRADVGPHRPRRGPRRPRPWRPDRAARPGRRRPGVAGQGAGVRPCGAGRSRRHRRLAAGPSDRFAAALRLPDPGGHQPGRAPRHRAAARADQESGRSD